MTSETPIKTILVLSANPKGTQPLRLGEEIREIKQGLREAKERDKFKIESAEAVRDIHIHRSILHYEPQIIHFSGHGKGEPGLAFEDNTGQQKLVDAEALAGLFELFADQVKCVVLNACYSEIQAKAIAQHIDYVIGMSQEIGDEAAIKFAIGFYDALGAGRDVEFAYKLGCRVIRIAGIPEHLTPQLLRKGKGGKSINTTTPQDTRKQAQRLQPKREEETDDLSSRTNDVQAWLNSLHSQSSSVSVSGDDLSSDVGVNYTRLRDLLKAGEWKQADKETLTVMLKVAKREEQGWLNRDCIENFPCTDLRTIDQLWVKYSNGRFGFSVQKRIYDDVGKDYNKFGERVGWRRRSNFFNRSWLYYSELTFSRSAPLGHLPRVRSAIGSPVKHRASFLSFLISRFTKCNI